MAVESLHATPHYLFGEASAVDGREKLEEGDWIEEALIYTEDLPAGFPTQLFHPFLDWTQGKYAIRVEIEVDRNVIQLTEITVRTQPAPLPSYTLKNVVFAKGIRMILVREDEEYPG